MSFLNTIQVRDADTEDIPVLAGLMNELGYPTSPDDMRSRFFQIRLHPDFRTLVAEKENRIFGFAGLSKNITYENNGIFVRILVFVVGNSNRRSGVAKALLAAIEEWAKKLNATKIVLTCGNREEREAAHFFYQKMGFEIQSTGYVKYFK